MDKDEIKASKTVSDEKENSETGHDFPFSRKAQKLIYYFDSGNDWLWSKQIWRFRIEPAIEDGDIEEQELQPFILKILEIQKGKFGKNFIIKKKYILMLLDKMNLGNKSDSITPRLKDFFDYNNMGYDELKEEIDNKTSTNMFNSVLDNIQGWIDRREISRSDANYALLYLYKKINDNISLVPELGVNISKYIDNLKELMGKAEDLELDSIKEDRIKIKCGRKLEITDKEYNNWTFKIDYLQSHEELFKPDMTANELLSILIEEIEDNDTIPGDTKEYAIKGLLKIYYAFNELEKPEINNKIEFDYTDLSKHSILNTIEGLSRSTQNKVVQFAEEMKEKGIAESSGEYKKPIGLWAKIVNFFSETRNKMISIQDPPILLSSPRKERTIKQQADVSGKVKDAVVETGKQFEQKQQSGQKQQHRSDGRF